MKITVSGEGFEQTVEVTEAYVKRFREQLRLEGNFDGDVGVNGFISALVSTGMRNLGDRLSPIIPPSDLPKGAA